MPLSKGARAVLDQVCPDVGLLFGSQPQPAPLPVGLWWIEEDSRNLTFRGQPVRVQREEPPAIDAGRFLEISGVEFVPSSAKAEVRFAYPDLAFVGHETFARTKQRWQVSNVRIAPLESVPL